MDEELQQRLVPFNEWRPHPRQEQFLSVPYDIFEVLYGGALGGGKTDVLIVAPIVLRTKFSNRQLYEHPEFTAIIFRRTFPELEKKVIPRARMIYESLGARYNETKKLFTFPSGAKIFLGHMEKESDVFQHDTNEYQYVGIDQAEQFTEFQLRYIASRIRTSNKDLPTIYRMAANPGGVSHTYLRDRFVKPAVQGGVVIAEKVTGMKRMYIPARLEDNPHLMDNDPDYVNRLSLLPEAEREAKRSGDWFTFSGQVFSEFRLRRFPNESENALHVIPPFKIPEYWPKVLSIDYGWTAKTFAIWNAISPEGKFYIYRCYSAKKTTTRSWASDIARLSQFDGNIVRVVIDSNAWSDGQQMGITVAEEFRLASGMNPEKSSKDRHSGVSLIHEALRFTPKPVRSTPPEDYNSDKADYILRFYGLKSYNEYLQSFTPEKPETNIPRLQILFEPRNELYSDNGELIEAIGLAQYDDHDKEDYADFDGDDPLDSLRYNLKATNVYLETAINVSNLLAKQGSIVKSLDETNDWTKYYMQMDKLDADRNKLTAKAVKRYN